MEFLIELVLDLFLEGGIEVSSNKKISKWIRYPIIFIIVAFFLAVISLLFIAGIAILKENILAGLLIIGISVFMLVGCIFKFRKIYLEKKDN